MASDVVAKATPIKCAACHQHMPSPAVCAHCHTLYAVGNTNHFALFGLDATFDVDPQLVQQRYLELAREVHPDRVSGGAPENELQSLRTTSQLNQARTVLLNPVLRAAYLLEMAGGKSSAEDREVPPEVLMESLELREQLAEAEAAGNDAELAKLRSDIESRRQATLEEISALARQLPGDEAVRQALRSKLNTHSYYQKMLEQH
jgi:molecular chaperone HscB